MTERDNIVNFLKISDELITIIVERRVYHFVFPRQQTILPLIHNAHEAVQLRLKKAIEHINHIKDDELIERLEQNGLTGAEWVFKVTIAERHINSVRKKIQDIPFQYEDKLDNRSGNQRRTLKRYIRRALKSIDVILDSIITAGVPIHPYKEFKDSLLSMFE